MQGAEDPDLAMPPALVYVGSEWQLQQVVMGRTFIFECPRCQYRAHVSGGPDHGFRFAVQTILCQNCKELHDAVVRLRVPVAQPLSLSSRWSFPAFGMGPARKSAAVPRHPPTFHQVLNQLWPRGVRHSRWVEFPLLCPKGSWHTVREWNQPDSCPRCGTLMEQTVLPYRLWE
jgi:hypothetical protein